MAAYDLRRLAIWTDRFPGGVWRGERGPRRGLRPDAEALEDRCLLAFDLQNGVLKETFDELTPGRFNFFGQAASWNDDQYTPAPLGSGQPPQPTSTPLFHHQTTLSPVIPLDEGEAVQPGGTTAIANTPAQSLILYGATDTITFPNVSLSQNEAVTVAALDIQRGSQYTTVTFQGTKGSEMLSDTTPVSSGLPPYEVIGQGSPGHGSSGVTAIGGAPTVSGWDTLGATSDDIGTNGSPIGPITAIVVAAPGNTAIDNVRVFVGFANPNPTDQPVAVDDTATDDSGSAIDIDVLANDSNPDGQPIHLLSVTTPTVGTAAPDPSHPDEVLYTPPAAGKGTATFSYTMGDMDGNTATASVTVQFDAPPNAANYSYSVPHGTTGSFSVAAPGLRANSSDPDGDPTVLSVSLQGRQGMALINPDGSFTYIPSSNGLVLADKFFYTITDDVSSVDGEVDLVPVDEPPPNPVDESYSFTHGQSGSLNVPADSGVFQHSPSIDSYGDPLIPVVDHQPTFGTVTFNHQLGNYDGSFVYTPYGGGRVLNDSFTYTLDDIYGAASQPATFRFQVDQNNPPTAMDETLTLDHVPPGTPITIPLPPAHDDDGDPLTYQVQRNASPGNVQVNGDGTITFTPEALSDSFVYDVSDGYSVSNTATVTLDVQDDVPEPIAPIQDVFGAVDPSSFISGIVAVPIVDSRDLPANVPQGLGYSSPGSTPVANYPYESVLNYVSDPDDQGRDTAELVTDAAHGHVVVRPDGSYVYTLTDPSALKAGGGYNADHEPAYFQLDDQFYCTADDGYVNYFKIPNNSNIVTAKDLIIIQVRFRITYFTYLNIINANTNTPYQPPTVVEITNANGGPEFSVAVDGGVLNGVVSGPNPSPGDTPANVQFPFGLVSYDVVVPAPGDAATLTLTLGSPNQVPDGFIYYQYGPTEDVTGASGIPGPDGNMHPNHWYAFDYDPGTGVGAKTHFDDPSIPSNEVVLYIRDGARGDDDLYPNGTIIDPGGLGGPAVDLALGRGPGSAVAVVGADASEALTVTNPGPIAATNVVVTDTLPVGATFVSASAGQGTYTVSSGILQYAIGTVAPGATVTITLVVRPLAAGVLTDTATVSSNLYDTDAGNNALAITSRAELDPRSQFVTILFRELLGRDPKPAELSQLDAKLTSEAAGHQIGLKVFQSGERRKLLRLNRAPHISLSRALRDAALAAQTASEAEGLPPLPAGPLRRVRGHRSVASLHTAQRAPNLR